MLPKDFDNETAELLARAKTKDRAAIEALLEKVAPAIHRFSLSMCGNPHDADDVLQDTLLNLVNHLKDFEGRSSLLSWAFALTRSACSRQRRGLKNQPAEGDDTLLKMADEAPSPEMRAETRELDRALQNALNRLPLEHREAVVLRDVEGLSAQEASEALGISVDALKSRLHRAREALRLALEPSPFISDALSGPCAHVSMAWSKKLEGDLSVEDCAAMEKHLLECTKCRAMCTALKEALGACHSVRSTNVPLEIQTKIKAIIQRSLQSTPY